ncbi:sarcosine oxidase subunit gamma [Belnapia sp. T6]|uniref:Sarcosine oxidase subunit gamma n=1 Tax=Belnapia mucosa TaxID=2804532 RepID=A0ABS1V0G1_9PROT|nr:sarcosine oxidase subunit gamma family protein [Belnapia mucosa]MBL6455052.1 sarcosine oxidase subunit gamma [Belnapia mucosa]
MAEPARIALRSGPAVLPALGAAFGLDLGGPMLRAAEAGPRAALRLGPDEWLLLAEDAPAAALLPALEAARGGAPASLVDVSDGFLALPVEGEGALDLLAEGCPLDLETIPEGGCTRSLYGKVEVVLWRRGPARWRLEVARSFAPHLRAHLAEAARDLP